MKDEFNYSSKTNLNFLKLLTLKKFTKIKKKLMDNKDVLFVNIMGVGKNGTTLLGSLLDNHHECFVSNGNEIR